MQPIEQYNRFVHADLKYFAAFHESPSPQRGEFQLHCHPFYEIIVFISGDAALCVEGTAYPLKPGCVLLMRPGELHEVNILSPIAYKRYVLDFDADILPEGPLRDTLLIPFHDRPLGRKNLYTADQFKLVSPVDLLASLEDMDLEVPYARTAILSRVPAILASLYEAFATGEAVSPQESAIVPIVAYINAHLGENLSSDQLCSLFYMSPSKLNSFFREHTHMSVGQYINIKRMHLARSLIGQGIPVSDVYVQCGYRDYSAFYRAYKKMFGEAPSAHMR